MSNTPDSKDWKLGNVELVNVLAAAQIAYRSQCPFEIDPATMIKICNELCDARRASVAAVAGDERCEVSYTGRHRIDAPYCKDCGLVFTLPALSSSLPAEPPHEHGRGL